LTGFRIQAKGIFACRSERSARWLKKNEWSFLRHGERYSSFYWPVYDNLM